MIKKTINSPFRVYVCAFLRVFETLFLKSVEKTCLCLVKYLSLSVVFNLDNKF